MPSLGSNIILVLDIGTSYIKCGCADSENNIIFSYQREFPMQQNGLCFEIDFDHFFDTTQELLKECLADPRVEDYKVDALLITSQAQTFAPVDADFNPLYQGIVWLDERAEQQTGFLQEQLPDFARRAGFSRPSPAQYVSKLLWLKQNEPDIFKKARAFPLINEYLARKLTGEFYSDSTSFGMGGIFDFSRNSINPELLSILGLTENFFPKIEKAAMRGEFISKNTQQDWDLTYGFSVFLCGNDQGASACGAGVKKAGDVNINFGTAMVFYTITESLATDMTEYQIAGKHPVDNDYFLLNAESDFGIQIRRLKDLFFHKGTYDQLFQTYYDYPLADEKAPPSMEEYLRLSTPSASHERCAGIIKYYINRLKVHFAQIRKSVELKNVFISGGMAQSKVWISILRKTLEVPLTVNNRSNAGLFGALNIYLQNKSKKK